MKDKKFHTLQAKLTLLVGMIVMISLIFFFGNFHLADVINREYATLIEQLFDVPVYQCFDKVWFGFAAVF